ncbi:helix-turn-helix domain-containing protein [Shimia sp. SDUM112013]|uniref:helix-turn-helix transcriptional regulator n=1 Tax=Shimia sp. SDUM112013 TaxID=3136160 RepID=UPI0032F06FDA
MGRSKHDPKGAVRDLFGEESQFAMEPSAGKSKQHKRVCQPQKRAAKTAPKFLTVKEVARRYGVHVATVWRWVKNDPNFPESIKLSPGTSRWRETDLRAYERRAEKVGFAKAEQDEQASVKRNRKGATS